MINVWCIGGSDNTCGAGIQKDLLTINALGCSAATIVTCVTSQNHQGISQIEPVSTTSFISQIETLLALSQPSTLKIGMLANAWQAAYLHDFILSLREKNPTMTVIVDPVCAASAGGTKPRIEPQTLLPLLAGSDLITPNCAEAEALTGISIGDIESAKRAGEQLVASLNKDTPNLTHVIVKGGHIPDSTDATDLYITPQQVIALHSSRMSDNGNHGTGCTFASALAAAIALDFPREDAVVVAKASIQQALKNSYPLLDDITSTTNRFDTTSPCGWPRSAEYMPRTDINSCGPLPSINRDDFRFYAVVDSVAWMKKLLAAGVKTLQLRIKDPTNAHILEQHIIEAITLGRQYNAQVFINDHWQLAIKHSAYGIHLGQEDMATANLAAIQAAGLRLGISTHGYMELVKAAAIKPSYIALGHIFATQTKDMPSQPQGLKRLTLYQQWASAIAPTVAIGGIKLHNLNAVLETGVDSVAVVTAITEAEDSIATTHTFLDTIHAHFNQ